MPHSVWLSPNNAHDQRIQYVSNLVVLTCCFALSQCIDPTCLWSARVIVLLLEFISLFVFSASVIDSAQPFCLIELIEFTHSPELRVSALDFASPLDFAIRTTDVHICTALLDLVRPASVSVASRFSWLRPCCRATPFRSLK